jgi:hypothetical protein
VLKTVVCPTRSILVHRLRTARQQCLAIGGCKSETLRGILVSIPCIYPFGVRDKEPQNRLDELIVSWNPHSEQLS